MDFIWTLSRLYRDFAVLTTKINSSQYRVYMDFRWTLSRLYRDLVVLTTKINSNQYRESTWTLGGL